METYVDIADLEAIKKVADFYPIDGFTTNPNILSTAEKPLEPLMAKYRAFVRENRLKIFFQVTGDTTEEMVEEAKKLYDYFGHNLVVKLPAIKAGYRAIKPCKEAGLNVCVTVVHSTMQAFSAAKAGADYVAPYVSHIDNLGAQSGKVIGEMVAIMRNYNYPCKVLGASFRTVEQVKELAVLGCDAVTITPEMFDRLIAHPSTSESMDLFTRAWEHRFGNMEISDLIK